MFKVINKIGTRVFIQSERDFRIIPIQVFNRAKSQKDRETEIRNPVEVIINGSLFIFKENQWDKAKQLAADYKKFCRGLPHLYRWESRYRFRKNKKNIAVIKSN